MEAARLVYKRDRTTRLLGQALVDGVPLNLASRTLEVRLAVSDTATTALTLGTGAGAAVTDAALGRFWWEVSPANLTALGDINNVWTVINVYNADNSLAFEAYGNAEVRL